MQKEYIGSAYIGVVGSSIEFGDCRDSIQNLQIRRGDAFPAFARYTKGFESRQYHINSFWETHHEFILLLDADMTFEPDLLERLREHKRPYVSGLYLRRQADPIAPIWFEPYNGKLPLMPWTRRIERGRLHKIGASGWGCVLIHRDVIAGVRKLLKGEYEVFESPMDIAPYDLGEIMRALSGLRKLVDESPSKSTIIPALRAHLETLESEIKPLGGDKRLHQGSDIRFPFFALKAGYQLWGDPDARAGHIINYPLHPNDYDNMSDEYFGILTKSTRKHVYEMRKESQKTIEGYYAQ